MQAKVNGVANVNLTLEADRVSAKDAEEVPRNGVLFSLYMYFMYTP